MICKNGRSLNAYNRGMKYLLKSAEIKATATNSFAIASALNYELRSSSPRKKSEICNEAIRWIEAGLRIENSKEMQYNLLRFLYMISPEEKKLIDFSENVVNIFPTQESVSLRLEILRINKRIDAGLDCIERYREFLDEIDLLMFHTTTGAYEEGFELCEAVCQKFSIDKAIASAIIECCLKTKHFNEAKYYADIIQENGNYISAKKNWRSKVFGNLQDTRKYREKTLSDYRMTPSFVLMCCYFGCDMHGTPW